MFNVIKRNHETGDSMIMTVIDETRLGERS